jgi:outer membrane lipoprotein-sorting protein
MMRLLLLATLAYAQAPFPDPAALLQETQANQRKMEDIRENYTFHRTVTEEDLDEKGSVVKTTVQEREIFFVNGHRIARLVKKDGVELKGKEEKNEQSRVTKLIETSMKSPPQRRAGQGGMIGQILPMATVSNPRRVTFHGRSTLAYDFTGDPRAKAKGTNENAAKKMAGTLWFDEADRQVARMEVHFYDNFRIGGFLASVQKGTAFEVERSPIGDGLWMETSRDEHVTARIAVRNFRQNTHARDFDFKKFNVEAVEKPSK